jgi:hypothetical protein
VPLIGEHRDLDPIPALTADNVERAARAIDGLAENDIVLESTGPNDVIVVGVLARQTRPPARSSEPEIGLNFTSTKPSLMLVPSLRAT